MIEDEGLEQYDRREAVKLAATKKEMIGNSEDEPEQGANAGIVQICTFEPAR